MSSRSNLTSDFSRGLRGADLSTYGKEIEEGRSTRTLTMRRQRRAAIPLSARLKLAAATTTKVDATEAIATLRSRDSERITALCGTLTAAAANDRAALNEFLASDDACEAFADGIGAVCHDDLVIPLLNALAKIFPLYGARSVAMIDTGVCYSIVDVLGLTNEVAVSAAVDVVAVIAQGAGYDRDALICCGIHDILFRIVGSAETTEKLKVSACGTLCKIFANPEPIESEIVLAAAESVCELVDMPEDAALKLVLELMKHLSNKVGGAGSIFFEQGVHVKVVGLLQKDDLCSAAMGVIGNLAVGEPVRVWEMIEAGLLTTLIGMVETEHASDALWVMSNLVETIPTAFMEIATGETVAMIVDIAETASYEIKRECAVFLATLIIYMNPTVVNSIVNPQAVEVIVDMWGCGRSVEMGRCLTAVMRICQLARARGHLGEFIEMMSKTDAAERIEDLLQSGEDDIVHRAVALKGILKNGE